MSSGLRRTVTKSKNDAPVSSSYSLCLNNCQTLTWLTCIVTLGTWHFHHVDSTNGEMFHRSRVAVFCFFFLLTVLLRVGEMNSLFTFSFQSSQKCLFV